MRVEITLDKLMYIKARLDFMITPLALLSFRK